MRRIYALALLVSMGTGAINMIPFTASAFETRAITFPVEGKVSFSDDFGDPRSGGRTHEGTDIFGKKLLKLLSAVDGRVTFMRTDSSGTSGNMVTIADSEGWRYSYVHVNNDSPGTDDGANPLEWAFVPGLRVGSRVVAGQHIGYLGDSGNAENTQPHLHFEIRRPDGSAINPYPSLLQAPRYAMAVGRDIAVNPDGGYYVLTGDGGVHPFGGAPYAGAPYFGNGVDSARAIAVMPDGGGYIILDKLGGLHFFGSAAQSPMVAGTTPYFADDIARDLAITPSGEGLAMLDGYGGVHAIGDVGEVPSPYWDGWDIARSISFSITGDGMYLLDGFGGIHTSGDAISLDNPYFGFDAGRQVLASPAGAGYALLDSFGAVHAFGDAPIPTGGNYVGHDRWRSVSYYAGTYYAMSKDGTSEAW